MDIFESLENLNVSEECFEDIVSIIEKYINDKELDNLLDNVPRNPNSGLSNRYNENSPEYKKYIKAKMTKDEEDSEGRQSITRNARKNVEKGMYDINNPSSTTRQEMKVLSNIRKGNIGILKG